MMKTNCVPTLYGGNRGRTTSILFLLFLFALTVLPRTSLDAQQSKGIISGKIIDAETGDALIGANVFLDGTTLGAATDLTGSYRIPGVPPGQYDLRASYMGYEQKKITEVAVEMGKVTTLNITLGMQVLEGQEVVVTAKAVKNNETVLLKDRQKAAAVSDAISAEAIAQAGSGNAAEAMKQVTGASVVDGKYVYVRGLGDRYTSTQLNGVEIPSTNPYRRAGSIDLIPTNLVDNIVTVKSFTPDKPGNFSGGTVDIKTKDFPDQLDINFSSSLSYNTNTTFNNNGPIGYRGSGMDWLGMDDGFRAIPDYIQQNGVPNVDYNSPTLDSLTAATRSFNNQMWTEKITPPINQSHSLSIGNQVNFLGRPLGLLGSLSYNKTTSSYNDGSYNAWDLVSQDNPTLNNLYHYDVTNTRSEVLWGSLLKAAYKPAPMHMVSFNFIYNQNGESYAKYLEGQYDYDKLDAVDDLHQNHVLGFNERRLTSFQFDGEHQFDQFLAANVNWKASLSKTKQDEPDLRYFTHYTVVDEDELNYGLFSNLVPQRYFRNLDENNQEYTLDFSLPFTQWSGRLSRFKMGGLYSKKDRAFEERKYNYSDYGKFDGNPENYFTDQNMAWDSTAVTINGRDYVQYYTRLYIEEADIGVNDYDGEQTISAGYAMLDMPLLNKLRFIGGVRYEKTKMNLVSLDERKDDGNMVTEDWLPSINLIYNLKDNMNLRSSVTRTLARPTMREMAPYASFDFAVGFVSIGNPALQRTLIDNYDLRWEWFSRPGEIYAVSAFYKNFRNPIERAFIVTANNREITWINVDRSRAMGLEFEFRKRLDVISGKLENFMIGSNLSLVRSEVEIPADELAIMRLKNPEMKSTRELEGQSPYLLNVSLNYGNFENGLYGSLYYNVYGARLSEVNKDGLPYVYEQPFSTLNLSMSKNITQQLKFKVSGKNLLNSKYKKTHEYKGQEYIFRSFTRGRSISAGFSYSL